MYIARENERERERERDTHTHTHIEIERAAWRERVEISGGGLSLKNKMKKCQDVNIRDEEILPIISQMDKRIKPTGG